MDAETLGETGKSSPGSDPLHDRDREDAPHRVRAFGRVGLLLVPVFWAFFHYLWEAPRAALVVAAVVLVWSGLSFLLPGPMGPVMRLWMTVTRPLGIVVTAVLLGGVYYLILTPLGLLRGALGGDPLRLKFRRGQGSTYWTPKSLPPAHSPRWYRPF